MLTYTHQCGFHKARELNILFLTTHNLATNPRLYKELRLAVENGHAVSLICFEFDNWSQSLNKKLKESLPGVSIVSIPAGRSPFFPWFVATISETFWRFVGRFIRLPVPLLAQAVSRRNRLLKKAIAKASVPDFVIGHNPGALFATLFAGKKFRCKMGFDVEDYHPGEGNNRHLQQMTKRLMQAVLPCMNYVSFASPLIRENIQKEVSLAPGHCFTLMNFFSATEFIKPSRVSHEPVKLIWFSQNIDYGRGLEFVLPYLKNLVGKVELHLFGNMNPTFYHDELKHAVNVHVHNPVPQVELHRQLAGFDIGLALEPAKDRNNELAVSNKILAYLQAGLYVIASETPAQAKLLISFPGHGRIFDMHSNKFEAVVEQVIANIRTIRSERNWRYQNFKHFNWELESQQLLTFWN